MTLWQDYLSTQFDPAHLLSEVGFTVVFELLQLAAFAVWAKRLHRRFDATHNLTHEEEVPR